MEINVECPHCNQLILIMKNEIRCNVFRHGVIKRNNKPMNPHTPKQICDFLAKHNHIYGCGKPFTLKHNRVNNSYMAVKCDYI